MEHWKGEARNWLRHMEAMLRHVGKKTAAQWQAQYSNLVAQLQLAGVLVKHCLPPPRNVVDVTPLKNWISTNYPSRDVIDVWTPLLQGTNSLNPAYDIGDGVHLNDAGHLLMGQIIRTNLP